MERFTGRHPGEWQHNRRITHLLKLNGGCLEWASSPASGETFHTCLPGFEKALGTCFYTGRNPTNYVGECLHQMLDIPYDVFHMEVCHVPPLQHRWQPYHTGNGSHITKAGSLSYMYVGAERSTILDWGIYHYTLPFSFNNWNEWMYITCEHIGRIKILLGLLSGRSKSL